jgi:hypothetical protein
MSSETITRLGAGRYAVFARGAECGQERWSIERGPEGYVISGAQEMAEPHPFPSRQDYRATLDADWRIAGLEVRWSVGGRELVAIHRAEGDMWRVRIEYAGHVKEQEGDFPAVCEVDFGTHLFSTILLARRDFAVGGEHEFTALRIGPPYMAVQPERMLYRCVEAGTRNTPRGPRAAKRYVVTIPGRAEPGYSFWSDERGIVLESYEGPEASHTWMRLVDYEWA